VVEERVGSCGRDVSSVNWKCVVGEELRTFLSESRNSAMAVGIHSQRKPLCIITHVRMMYRQHITATQLLSTKRRSYLRG